MYTYVLSTGRTGTNFLAQQLNTHFPALKLSHQQQGSRIINIVANLPLTNSVYLSFLEFLLRFFRRGWPPHSTIDPLLSMAIYKVIKYGRIQSNNCRIVHLVRSPENFVTSFMNWKRQSFKRTVLHHLIPFWNPVPFFHGYPFFSWIRMSKFEQFCWVWNYKNRRYSELSNHHYMLLKMEDLVHPATRKDGFQKLASFLGVESHSDIPLNVNTKVNKSRPKGFPPYKEWTEEQKSLLHTHCAKLMKIWEYGVEWRTYTGRH
jgi:hypothetical protein